MSAEAESSKKASKRAKKQMVATVIAASIPSNPPINISDGASNSPNARSGEGEVGGHSHTLDERLPASNEERNSSTRKGRGKAKLIEVGKDGPRSIEFNERDQPIGENSQSFVSTLGVLAREIVPITLESWDNMTNDMADRIWSVVKQRFIVEDCYRRTTFATMKKLWQQHKSKLTKEVTSMQKNSRQVVLMKPDNVNSLEEWQNFVKSRFSNEFKEKSQKFKALRAKQTMPHTLSRKGYARLEAEMRLQSDVPDSISRVDIWIKGHLRKDNTPSNEEVGEAVRRIQELSQSSQSTSIRDDAVTQVIGAEHRGRVRGLGFGARISIVDGQRSERERDRKHEAEMREMKTEYRAKYDNLQAEVTKLKEIVSQFTTAASQKSQSGVQPPVDVCGQDCEILDWFGTGEVVGAGEVESTDPSALIAQQLPIGPGCWKVWVNHVFKPEIPLYRATPGTFALKDVHGSTTAWPSSCIRLTGG